MITSSENVTVQTSFESKGRSEEASPKLSVRRLSFTRSVIPRADDVRKSHQQIVDSRGTDSSELHCNLTFYSMGVCLAPQAIFGIL